MTTELPHRIVIVGGGAGGLELATRLGDTLGKRGKASITLVDLSRTHLWKPLLHQVAAGSLDLGDHELDYLAQARWHHFNFQLGRMEGLDRQAKEIWLAATYDEEGRQVLPRRAIAFDTLILAVGSTTNDFGTPGAAEHAISLDRPEQAATFHRRLVNACLRANTQTEPLRPEQLHVAIIGAGATGVELAAELHNTTRELLAYGLDRIDAERDIRITIVEAAERILPALPPRLSLAAEGLLRRLGVQVITRDPVSAVDAYGIDTASGERVDAELVVWAAGIKAPDFLRDIAGLESNRLGQLVVAPTLQTTRDPDIFALGDCAACPWPEHGGLIPPRAQAAHQQASHLVKAMRLRLAGRPLKPFRYRDFGSLVSLGKYSTVGSLMGGLNTGALTVEGRFALLMYKSLYKMHLLALHGPVQVFLDTLARIITRRGEPRVKLH
ncbi:MAG: FAD-dependent oxidoreductase [Alphaproteobacteria bacterium CG_4_10_14_0_2_um_filter_63_37]|nr:MAG: FAD-dependent oxidoreductase [Proteobacteria bacterium CG1_02_64_396]PJA24415.1 MAG: FAD-dependent oxidoreductase [Alphaproteobacteria bacterium CG_4_10_14_0_2_um_filter_63_37]